MKIQEIELENQIKEKYGYIYLTTNLINGKKYIGQRSYKADKHATSYYLGSGKYLSLAIKKYGRENFTREILDEAYSREELNEKEKYWIAYYNAVEDPNFYNILKGGNCGLGRPLGSKYTEEEKQRMRKPKSSRGVPRGPQPLEVVAKRAKANSHPHKKYSPEGCANISKGKLAKEQHYNLGNKNRLGHKCSEEQKQKQSEFMKGKQVHLGYNQSDYQKQRVKETRSGSKDSEETRLKKVKAFSTPVQNLNTGEIYLSASQAEIQIKGKQVWNLSRCIKNKKPFNNNYFAFIKDINSPYTEEERQKFLQDPPNNLPSTDYNYIQIFKDTQSKKIKIEDLDNYISLGWKRGFPPRDNKN